MKYSYQLYRNLLSLVSIVALVNLTSCGISSSSNNNTESIADVASPNVNTIYEGKKSMLLSSTIIFPPNLSEEEERKMRMAYVESFENACIRTFSKEVATTTSWQEAHTLAQECIRKTSNMKYTFDVHQLVASSMLRVYFCTQYPTPEIQKAVEYYMNILLSYKNYGDPNLKAAVLPLLIGYWSPDKITSVARTIFEYNVSPTFMVKDKWMEHFYSKQREALTKKSPELSTLSTQQMQAKIKDNVITQMGSFPKRLKPLMNMMFDTEDYKELYGYNGENLAILALMADGVTPSRTNK